MKLGCEYLIVVRLFCESSLVAVTGAKSTDSAKGDYCAVTAGSWLMIASRRSCNGGKQPAFCPPRSGAVGLNSTKPALAQFRGQRLRG